MQKKFTYRGVDLDKLLSMPPAEFTKMLPSRLRRRFDRSTLNQKHLGLLKRLRKAKKEAKPAPGELHARPATVKVSVGFLFTRAAAIHQAKPGPGAVAPTARRWVMQPSPTHSFLFYPCAPHSPSSFAHNLFWTRRHTCVTCLFCLRWLAPLWACSLARASPLLRSSPR